MSTVQYSKQLIELFEITEEKVKKSDGILFILLLIIPVTVGYFRIRELTV